MYTVTEILPVKVPDSASLQQTQYFEQCRPRSVAHCDIEAKITRPEFQVEVRRYFWDKPLKPTLFEPKICYLELSLTPRPQGAEVNYLGGTQPQAFVPTGNCSFIPAHHKALMRCPQGEQRVIGCMFDMKIFEPFVDWQWTPLELAACFNISNLNIRVALVLLSQEALNPDYKSTLLVDSLFQYLLVELSRHIRASRQTSNLDSGKLSASKLRLIEARIAETVGPFPQTSWLAEQCGISTRHLARMFKYTTGKTITEYITEIRINRAKMKLINSQQLIKEIAYECGFQGQSSFAQAFKKATGFTPRQFRNQTLE